MTHLNQKATPSDALRNKVAAATLTDETISVRALRQALPLTVDAWDRIAVSSGDLITQIRSQKSVPLIDQFLVEYGLSSEEGVQLMSLAEALSRTTDRTTADELITDKIMNGDWLAHCGSGHTIAMQLVGIALYCSHKWLSWSHRQSNGLGKALANAGNSVLRGSTRIAIRALSSQFVFAETLSGALKRAAKYHQYRFSFDMLGEAARAQEDAAKYLAAYANALDVVAGQATSSDPRKNEGISIKLSALHPRYEYGHAEQVVPEICALLRPLLLTARKACVQITIDAEEAERLDISMDVLAYLVAMPELQGWDGLGFVVQAYQKRALPLLDWLAEKAEQLGAPLVVRLVKGAYWDSEIKRAQALGLDSYPVYTRKETTDLSYLACAQKLLTQSDRFSPQFATHNAHSIAAIIELAGPDRSLEFQRLFGMGQSLHDIILNRPNVSCRIYAPVGTQKDLLSYLIRRLLENGANSSFVHKLADPAIPVAKLTEHPIALLNKYPTAANDKISAPRLYPKNGRLTAIGFDFSNPLVRSTFQRSVQSAGESHYQCAPVIAGKTQSKVSSSNASLPIFNPAIAQNQIGDCIAADQTLAKQAVSAAKNGLLYWSSRPRIDRAAILDTAAELLEQRAETFHYLAIREAGKTWSDAVDEVREAIDFCRYYAAQIRQDNHKSRKPLGVIVCISPWNFPLAIFLGQITAALAAGNTVVAKPAEQTPLIAAEAVRLLHDAGVDPAALNLVPGTGALVGDALVSHPDVAAICFTGSTATAKRIALRLVETDRPLTPFIAETGGINAMIVDSSALLEQTVDAIISSAFQSAGQRCSALRILCLQEDIADQCIALLRGAMAALRVGDPWQLSTDVGPVIDRQAKEKIDHHIERLETIARRVSEPVNEDHEGGNFVHPAAFELSAFDDLDEEIFGPILHIIRFSADQKSNMISQINNSGYGLTLGIQSRIDSLCDRLSDQANVGNIYINRDQIGAVVGAQPFGGHGLSGTGPKAGGPLYLYRLSKSKNHPPSHGLSSEDRITPARIAAEKDWKIAVKHGMLAASLSGPNVSALIQSADWRELCLSWSEKSLEQVRKQILNLLPQKQMLPSTAGETNQYSVIGRGLVVSLTQDPNEAIDGCLKSIASGNAFLQVNRDAAIPRLAEISAHLSKLAGTSNLVQQMNDRDLNFISADGLNNIGAIFTSSEDPNISEISRHIAQGNGPLLPILTSVDDIERFVHEKTITYNIAAAGGDVSLLNALIGEQ